MSERKMLRLLKRGLMYGELGEDDQKTLIYFANAGLCHAAFNKADGMYKIEPAGRVRLASLTFDRASVVISCVCTVVSVVCAVIGLICQFM